MADGEFGADVPAVERGGGVLDAIGGEVVVDGAR
jgi:hypothetical protein